MASLEKRGTAYRVVFRYGGRKYNRSLRTGSEKAAQAALARLEDNLHRVAMGTLVPPDDADLALFLLSDGRVARQAPRSDIQSLSQLFDAYRANLANDSVEPSTLRAVDVAIRHLTRIFGGTTKLHTLRLADLQRYIEKRSKDKGLRGRNVTATTIKKDVDTLKTIWNWALATDVVNRPLPKRGLRYPKTDEKPPFQTWEEIERRIARGGLTEAEEAELWDCLFLTLPEIDELLGHVKSAARRPFIYPMFVFAAHTGARRSEMMRSEIEDIDFEGQTALIRERKRVRGKRSTRRVPVSPMLADVLREWFERHPGGKFTFCLAPRVGGNVKGQEVGIQLREDHVYTHFKETLAGSKWEKLRGWHAFRHSFCSNCAAKGIDQRLINAWVGHQTEEMVRRYRHLIPNQQQEAIRVVFAED